MEIEKRSTVTGKILIFITGSTKKKNFFLLNFHYWNLFAIGGVAVGLSVICVSFVTPALRKFCLPYVPATNQQIKNIFKALEQQQNIRGSNTLLDIGSGDGRIVLEAAKRGFESYGVELNLWLVLYARFESFRRGLKTRFIREDLWKHNLKRYDNVVIFGVEQMVILKNNKNVKIVLFLFFCLIFRCLI